MYDAGRLLEDFVRPSTVTRISHWVHNEIASYHLDVLVEEEYCVLETIRIDTFDIKRKAGWAT